MAGQTHIDVVRYAPALTRLGVLDAAGRIQNAKSKKLQEVAHLLPHLLSACAQTGVAANAHVVDFGVGKGYALFLLNAVLQGEGIRCTGVDADPERIAACVQIAEDLAYSDMAFVCSDIASARVNGDVHVSYSLHACDKATDQAIARGIQLGAERILAVPCCHKDVQKQLTSCKPSHPLKYEATRFGLIRDRLAILLADTFRALALSACGYEVKMLEFAAPRITPKNTLIVGVKHGKGNRRALAELCRLRNEFGVESEIGRLLEL